MRRRKLRDATPKPHRTFFWDICWWRSVDSWKVFPWACAEVHFGNMSCWRLRRWGFLLVLQLTICQQVAFLGQQLEVCGIHTFSVKIKNKNPGVARSFRAWSSWYPSRLTRRFAVAAPGNKYIVSESTFKSQRQR